MRQRATISTKIRESRGFSLTHLSGVGCPIFADVPILPWTGAFDVSPGKDPASYAVAFDHSAEQAHPGYYSITLGNGVKVELTVAERSGIARFRFPEGQPARLLVDAGRSADTDVHLPLLRPGGRRDKDGSQVELTGNKQPARDGDRGRILLVGYPLHAVLCGCVRAAFPAIRHLAGRRYPQRRSERPAASAPGRGSILASVAKSR